uniref:Photosystem II reaction center protein Z n=1 Tax=Euglenaformis proxima TaxID=299110 RepID=A0A023HHP1_9EUGL|nr:photosystem II protein Z [Euglenaformis proxima]AGL12022.1 photosystem II protein Z [Euglenaformis proxima]
MNIVILGFQLSLLFLVLVSFLMVVSVPVFFASPNGWGENKSYILFGSALWIFLVAVVGILNYFVI